MIARRRTLALLALSPLCLPGLLSAQPRRGVARLGYLHIHSIEDKPSPERAAFLAGMHALGYREGRNLVIEYRGTHGEIARLPELARELVALRVDVIVAVSADAAAAAKGASSTIPVVVTVAGDPVHTGLVQSYARPGGNVTGLSFISPDLGAKRIELLREIVPAARRIAVIWNALDSVAEREWNQAREAARSLGLEVDARPVREAADLAATLEALPRERPDALLVVVDPRMVGFRKIVADAALKARVPCIAGWRGYVESGALASYAPDFPALFYRAASYVDRILKGARPQDLPVEQPSRFELVLNLRTAASIGVAVPKTLLARADYVIQ